ncbi:chemotaxis-specific protein-glutamate methyltransferase CheB [Vreelandella massiliensis]|uniref:chemotaxis-specific protein-glutamate methyltransferase CheB n=1 Tax=Vreelandella massiliensis TaxID=1816686 RepID=UPI00096AC52E|nr:chemotaxis-specific protein-glutamate methyltransferase CheB [Halomonas massiliensis]
MSLKVLIVDDSALMRRQLKQMLERAGDIVSEVARDGQDALVRLEAFDPDVITLDINMPVMDGLACLSHIMAESPRPVIMVSSLTEKGALATFEALELGAFDYVNKPGGTVSLNLRDVEQELQQKVRAAANQRQSMATKVQKRRLHDAKVTRQPRQSLRSRVGSRYKLVVVGVSTGGPSTLESILRELPAGFPVPIVVAQHMPAHFTKPFAERLDRQCALKVTEVRGPALLEPGHVYIARGDADARIVKRAGNIRMISIPASDTHLWHPSISRLVTSAREVYQDRELICVQLTGMGDDGAAEMASAHQHGALTIAESEASAVVFGMPRALIEQQGAGMVLESEKIAAQLVEWASR